MENFIKLSQLQIKCFRNYLLKKNEILEEYSRHLNIEMYLTELHSLENEYSLTSLNQLETLFQLLDKEKEKPIQDELRKDICRYKKFAIKETEFGFMVFFVNCSKTDSMTFGSMEDCISFIDFISEKTNCKP